MQKKRLDKKQIKKTVLQVALFALALFAVFGLFALKAYAACAHQYVNGNCIHCGITCQTCDGGSALELIRYDQYLPNIHKKIYSCRDCGLVEEIPANCVYDDGVCEYCSFSCSHSDGVRYTYSFSTGATKTHTIRAICDVCGDFATSDPLDFTYALCEFENGTCKLCKHQCAHATKKTSYSQRPNDFAIHNVITTCTICNITISEDVGDHAYSNSKCSSCGMQCTHERWTDGKCTYCKTACSHSKYTDGKCSTCGKACAHSSTTVSYAPRQPDDYYLHDVITTCSVCKISSSDTAVHTYIDSICTVCDMRCTHERFTGTQCTYCDFECPHISFNGNKCKLCNYVCDHTNIISFSSTGAYNTYYYKCLCGYSHRYSKPNYANHCVDFFRPAPFDYYWNSIVSEYNIDIIADKSSYNHVYTRVYIDRFLESDSLATYDFKATAHMTSGDIEKLTLSNGYDYECISGRYLVLRMRMSDIDYFEFDLMGGMGVDDIDDYGYADYYYRDYDILPDNEWINLVVDLSTFSALNGNDYAYVIGSQIDSFFLKICCAYDSADGFIDYEFYALCDDLSEVHAVCNSFNSAKSGTQLDLRTYLATRDSTKLIANKHEFSLSNGEMICWCYYKCTHESSTKEDYQTDTHCGYTVSCDSCGLVSERSDYSHRFLNNSDTCSRCSYVCDHFYSSGVCSYCEWECIHNCVDGTIRCSNCGYYVDYEGYDDKDGFFALFTAIYDAQANTFFKMLGYEILGVNIAGLIVSILALAVIAWILKKVL